MRGVVLGFEQPISFIMAGAAGDPTQQTAVNYMKGHAERGGGCQA